MKNIFISVLILTFFSVYIFAADDSKIQLELAVLYSAFAVAEGAAWVSADDSVRSVAWYAALAAARFAAGEAARSAAWDAAVDVAWSPARSAARSAADAAARGRVINAAIASWIVIIEKLPKIHKEVVKRTKEKFKILTPLELDELYSKVIKIFNKSFNHPKYSEILSPIKIFYAASLARIFHVVDFEDKLEFISYKNNICPDVAALVRETTKMPPALCNLIINLTGDYDRDPSDPEVLHAYVLNKLLTLKAELKQKPQPAYHCCVS